jgi:hypothetical protein
MEHRDPNQTQPTLVLHEYRSAMWGRRILLLLAIIARLS